MSLMRVGADLLNAISVKLCLSFLVLEKFVEHIRALNRHWNILNKPRIKISLAKEAVDAVMWDAESSSPGVGVGLISRAPIVKYTPEEKKTKRRFRRDGVPTTPQNVIVA